MSNRVFSTTGANTGNQSVDADKGFEGYVAGRNGCLAREGQLLLVEVPVGDEMEVAVHRVAAAVAPLQVQLRRSIDRLAVDFAGHGHLAAGAEGVCQRIAGDKVG